MAKGKFDHQMSQEEREEESRKYIESQEPIVQEAPVMLNQHGQNVEAPKASAPKEVAPKAGK